LSHVFRLVDAAQISASARFRDRFFSRSPGHFGRQSAPHRILDNPAGDLAGNASDDCKRRERHNGSPQRFLSIGRVNQSLRKHRQKRQRTQNSGIRTSHEQIPGSAQYDTLRKQPCLGGVVGPLWPDCPLDSTAANFA
jgi:hypothetical protein